VGLYLDFSKHRITGDTGKPIKNVVNIGIGGSDLGPVMAYEACATTAERDLTFRFVSNVDGTDFAEATRDLDPDETLFIVSSKTFTTLETMTNAHSARDWRSPNWAARRPSQSTSSPSPPTPKEGFKVRHRHRQHVRLLGLGRRPLLHGLRHRPLHHDRHRPGATSAPCSPASTPWTSTSAPPRSSKNLPVLMGLLTVWYNDFFDAQTVAVLPYEQYLKRFPAYLQQLTMESNGKHVTLDGTPVAYHRPAHLLGRARHQRPALLLPAHPPGHQAHPLRLHRLRQVAQPLGRATTTC
jgi:glucose-6-phosphate isomerase